MSPKRLEFRISPQPDDASCGPTCLHAIYRYWGDELDLRQVIDDVPQLDDGGTLAVQLGCHALRRGYASLLYTYNLQMWDPTWFQRGDIDLRELLRAQMEVKSKKRKLQFATESFLEYLDLGGEVRMDDLTRDLLRRHLKRGVPILAGLSATWLYHCAREVGGDATEYDDVRGTPQGHFVVMHGYERKVRRVLISDPHPDNPVSKTPQYLVDIDRLVSAITLGVLTYDANLLVITPRESGE
jgi:hypothetical protein